MEVFQKKFVEEAAEVRKGFMMSVEQQHERKFKLVVNGQVFYLVGKSAICEFYIAQWEVWLLFMSSSWTMYAWPR